MDRSTKKTYTISTSHFINRVQLSFSRILSDTSIAPNLTLPKPHPIRYFVFLFYLFSDTVDQHLTMFHFLTTFVKHHFLLNNSRRTTEVVELKLTSDPILRSGSSTELLFMPKSRTVTHGDRCFEVASPILWNNLPVSLRTAKCVTQFRSQLKTHLFKVAFT